MRKLACLTLLLFADAIPAQGVLVPVPPFARTYSSSSGTRGIYFQAPSAFVITGVQVPDEAGAGVQNVEIYTSAVAPPAYPALITPTLRYSAYNQPVTGTPLAVGSVLVAPGEWVIAIGATGTATMNNSYAAPGSFASNVLGQPITINRCGTQTNIFTNNGPNTIWSENAAAPSRVELYVTPAAGYVQPPSLEATAEAVAGSTPLGIAGGPIQDNWTLRWNYADPTNNNQGQVIFTIFNYGFGGSAPIGVSPQIPYFNQVWAASTPSGIADILGPTLIGWPDTSVVVPPGLFAVGDTVRMQGLVLDFRVQGPSRLPANPTLNSIEFRFQ